MLALQAALATMPAPHATGLTLTLSMLHAPPADLTRIRRHGWLLACVVTADQVRIALPALNGSDEQNAEFLSRLCALGYTRWLADLLLWACAANFDTLVFDPATEPSDRLPIFVG
jgi:hypothetical protein